MAILIRVEIILNNFLFPEFMRIKQFPQDFIVKEVTNINVKDNGDYTYFNLKKTNYNTIDAIETVAKKLNISSTRFGFAGNKDKNAITEQLVSVDKKIQDTNLKDIEIKVIGYGDKYISLGDLKGNKFEITVKDLSEEEIKSFESKQKPFLMPNLFGEQRFSSQNVDVGKAIIKRDFEKAAELLKLDIINNNYIGAIRKINKKVLRLYIHAYQSYIFNETIKRYSGKENEKIPVVGFGTELDNYDDEIKKIISKILKEEDLDLRDFITVKIPELSEEGTERDLFVEIENLEVLGKGNDWIKIKFFLQKGSYATEAIKFLFS
jgi:tRNA(Glu) U13 pseudouridine synthase TruD